jgi:hypothetical protein
MKNRVAIMWLVAIHMMFVFVNVSFSQGQKDWISFSSPTKSFTIRLPELPIQETKVAKRGQGKVADAEFSIFKCSKSINYYRLSSRLTPERNRLVIREIDITGCKRKSTDFETELMKFLTFIVGKTPVLGLQQSFEENKLQYRKISYDSGLFYEGTTDSKIRNVLTAINAGRKIFILIYNAGEGTMGEQMEIFRTFTTTIEKNPLIISEPKAPIPLNKEKWTTFRPIDKSFTVELPESPKLETRIATLDRENETDINLYLLRCTKSVTSYSLPSLKEPNHHRISIFVTDVSRCKRKKNEFYDEINGLFSFIGGDNRKALSDKMVKVNGLHGREIIYKNGSEIYGRTLAVDAGNKIIFLTYNRINGDLSEEERILRTFKPQKVK